MVPLTPSQSGELMQKQESIPFSKDIKRIGFEVSMPLFIKSIYDNKDKMNYLIKATNYKTDISLYKKQTLLVGYVSKLDYLFSLNDAIKKQRQSIKTTYEALSKGVKVGRIAEFKLLRLKDSLNQIDIKLLDISQNIKTTKSDIYKITQIDIKTPIIFDSLKITKGEFISLKPLQAQSIANEYGLKAKKDNKLPKVILKLKGSKIYGNAYNTDESIEENFASAGIYISWDIFDRKNNSEVQKSKIELIKTKLQIAKTKKDLIADIAKIDKNLNEILKQIKLTKNSINLKKELLKGAKVAFRLNRMSVDDYLKYEDDLAKTKANLASLIANKNMLKAQKALIYGKNLKKVFK